MLADSNVAEVAKGKTTARLCKDTNERGEPCSAPVVEGSEYCFWHDPALAKERAEARKRGGYGRRQVKAGEPGEPVQARSPQDVVALVERAINDALALENSIARARAIGYLAGVALKAQEVGELEERLEALEQAFKEGRQ